MLATLKNKLLAWTPESANSFHNNITRHHHKGGQVWETTPTGYYLIGPSITEYRDYNGHRYVLESGDHTASLQTKQALSALAQTLNMAQIENVVSYEVTDVYGLPYTYSVHLNPVATRGIPLENAKDVTDNSAQTIEDIVKTLLKEADNFVLALDQITEDTSSLKYPEKLDLSLLNYDPATETYFWSGNLNFSYLRSAAINEALVLAGPVGSSIYTMFYKTPIDIQSSLQTYINTECTIYQNP